MKKSIFIILILAMSLIFVSCTPASPDTNEGEPPITGDEDTANGSQEDVQDPGNSEGDKDEFVYSVDKVEDFDLEISLLDGSEIDYDFDRSDNDEVLKLLGQIEINLDRSLNDMMGDVLTYLDISRDDVDEFELEVDFLDGKEIDFKYDREEGSENKTVDSFDLEIDFKDGSQWDFDYELNDEYEVEGRENLSGDQAKTRIEGLIEALDISMDNTIREIQEKLFSHLNINVQDVKDFDLDVEYLDGMEIDVRVNY